MSRTKATDQQNGPQWPELDLGEAAGLRINGEVLVTGALQAATLLGSLAQGSVRRQHLAGNAVNSAKVAEADGQSGQMTNRGRGIKTNHIQDDAITHEKLGDEVRKRLGRALADRSLKVVSFTEEDADGATEAVELDFQPNFILAITSLTSRFGGFKPHGGISVGFADLVAEPEAVQISLGPAIHVVSEGQEITGQRSSIIGPDSGVTSRIGDGFALGLVQHKAGLQHRKELVLARVEAQTDNAVTISFRREVVDDLLPSEDFRLSCYLLFFG